MCTRGECNQERLLINVYKLFHHWVVKQGTEIQRPFTRSLFLSDHITF